MTNSFDIFSDKNYFEKLANSVENKFQLFLGSAMMSMIPSLA